jgi:hypothetical protein
MAGSEFHSLAESTNVNGLVAFDAANVVIGGSKSIRDRFALAENELVVFESAVASRGRRYGICNAFIYGRAECAKPVE